MQDRQLTIEGTEWTPEVAEPVAPKEPIPCYSEMQTSPCYEDLLSEGITIVEEFRDDHWRLGDWAVKVKTSMGRKTLDKMAPETGESAQTIKQCAWVSEKFPDQVDRATHLSWSHYRAAAGTKNHKDWLEKAIQNDWTVKAMRDAIKAAADIDHEAKGMIDCHNCHEALITNGYYLRHAGSENAFCGLACLKAHVEALVAKEAVPIE